MSWLRGISLVAFCCLIAAGPLQAQGSTWEALIKGAEAALERRDFASAEEQLKAALDAAERFAPGDPRLGKTLNNLAAIYYAQGDFRRAEPLLRRAIKEMEQAVGPNDPDLAQSLKNLAALYYLQGDHAAAEPLLIRSLTIWEQAVGTEHPYVATLLSNLAGLYQAQGQYSRAEPLLVRSLSIWETILGPNHPDVAQSRQLLERLQAAMAGEVPARGTLTAELPPAPRPRPTADTLPEDLFPEDPFAAALQSQPAAPAESQATESQAAQSQAAESPAAEPSERHSAVVAFSRTAIENDLAETEKNSALRQPETASENTSSQETQVKTEAKTQEAKAPGRGIALLLSSFRTREAAEGHWAQLQQDFPGLLEQKDLLVEEVTMAERGTFFRVVSRFFRTLGLAACPVRHSFCAV